jgi:drug/metabolite transporter (DMT)-like permease
MSDTELHSPRIHPYLALAFGAAALSTAAVLVKMTAAPAAVVAFYRMFFTVLLMTPVILLFYRSEWRVLQQRDWLFCKLSGLFLGLHFVLWFESLQYTSVASSVVLVTLQPLFTFAGGYLFYKEKVGLKALLGGCLAILGAIVICWGDFQVGGLALLGNALALLGAVMVSAYWLVGQRARRKLSMMMYTYIVYSFSALFILVYVLVSKQPLIGFELNTWLIFVALAVFPTLLGHSIFNWSLRWVSASVVSVTVLFEPVGAALLAYVILDENLQWTQWIGGTLILSGIYVFIRQHATSTKK